MLQRAASMLWLSSHKGECLKKKTHIYAEAEEHEAQPGIIFQENIWGGKKKENAVGEQLAGRRDSAA